MRHQRLWPLALLLLLAGCPLQSPRESAGPCGGDEQDCCPAAETASMGLAPNGCRAGLVCATRPSSGAIDAGAPGGRAACRACPPSDPEVCDNICVDLRSDPGNCGRCGVRCTGSEVCVTASSGDGGVDDAPARDGASSVAICLPSCPAGQTPCAGRGCSTLATDPTNCGACGNTCMTGQSCTAGRCVCAGTGNLSYCSAINRCVDLQTDATNCGACGTACPVGQNCTAGRCACANPGLTFCPSLNRCVDLQSDTSNCGTCGNACMTGQSCTAGRCVCAGSGKLSYCTAINRCVDLMTDTSNCGMCGTMCPDGQNCTGGRCACSNPGLAFCPTLNRCVDLQSDADNCGTCGNPCPSGQSCVRGMCACSNPGLTFCAASMRCVDFQTDPTHCGTCGNICPTGQACTSGRCACPGTAGLSYCAALSRCVDLQTDITNCGACGTMCPPGQPCADGRCNCPGAGLTFCAGTVNRCIDLQTDPTHCGSCGTACRPGEQCTGGMCVCPGAGTGFCPAINRCTDLQNDQTNCGMCGRTCNPSETCRMGTCTCPMAGQSFCAGTGCTNLMADINNCGACGRRCPEGQVCGGGTCRCPTGLTLCGSTCVDLTSNNTNCSACGTNCETTFANGLGACIMSRCTPTACRLGFGDCDRNPANGCEVNLTTESRNCGTCGNQCRFANAAALCSAGLCAMGPCNAGFADCNMNPIDGCETDTRSDTDNCITCGNRCTAPPGRTPICVASSCTAGSTCMAPTADCNGVSGDGCEVNTNTDVNHCGTCGARCNATNGVPMCSGGVCTSITCNAGFGDCDGNLGNGCEVDHRTAVNHCGTCGNRCVFPNATASCTASVCTLGTCTSGFGNCDGNAANGCEASLAADNANCGACGRACSGGSFCVMGACVCPAGQVSCSGTCVNLQSDNTNCGGCGTVCGAGTRCSSGMCVASCSGGTTDCSASGAGCVNTSTNTSHCGGCGMACASTGGTPACTGGNCNITCASGFGQCDGNARNGCEALNTATNCGSCGTACNTGAVMNSTAVSCSTGTCRPTACATGYRLSADMTRCEVNCGFVNGPVCTTGSPCVEGATPNPRRPSLCTSCGGALQLACTSGAPCRVGLTACTYGYRYCYDLQTTLIHCGACGNACPSNSDGGAASCVSGVCR